MHDVVRDDALCFVVVLAAGIQVPIKTREIAARHLNTNSMTGLEIVARGHRLQRYLINPSSFQPREWLFISVPVPQSLDRLVKVVGPPVRIDVDQFHREIRVLRIRRNIQRDLNRAR